MLGDLWSNGTWMAYACAGVVLLCLILYVLTAGADFGGGILALFSPRSSDKREKWSEMIDNAIAPIWESNHIWLIVAIVVLFVCFPVVFSQVGIGLHLPLSILLIGISLRGTAFVFAHYDTQGISERWRRVFMLSSVLCPMALGTIVGALSSEHLAQSLQPVSQNQPLDMSIWWSAWMNPLSLMIGLMTTALFTWLAAIYLYHEVNSNKSNEYSALSQDLRQRAFISQSLLGVSAALALLSAGETRITDRLLYSGYAPYFHFSVAAVTLAALWSLWRGKSGWARFFGAAQAVGIILGWVASSLPYLIPPTLTIEAAASPQPTLKATLICVVIALVLVLPSLACLYWLFKGETSKSTSADESSHPHF